MAFNQASNAFDLLGQAERPGASVRLHPVASTGSPNLDVGWGEFRQSLASSVRAILSRPFAPRKFINGEFFRDCWVERRIPLMALLAAALWHIVFVIFPFPHFPNVARTNPALKDFQLTWSGPINDFPILEIPGPKAKPSPRGEPDRPLPVQGADAFHPRQRIFTDPENPSHPRQTLINRAAPPEAPKILPNLPNIVALQPVAGPAKPRLEISEDVLKKLRPREHRTATVTETPLPDVPNFEQKPAELAIANSQTGPARPKLQLNAGAAPRVAQRAQSGDSVTAPEVGGQQSAANASPATLIALSATPGPPAPVQPPQGNLSARVSISPEGKTPGAPGGVTNSSATANGGAHGNKESAGGTGTNTGGGKNSVGVSISGGNPEARNGVSGLGSDATKASTPSPRLLVTRPDSHAKPTEESERVGPPNFAALPPGAKPEQIFASKKVYTLYVNMPNLNSATGSWILHFSELHNDGIPHMASTDLAAPVVQKKIDPKYPPTLISEHVEGEVVLYAVIRRDGTVDSIQLVRGIDEQLDANAMDALSRWKFTPATKQGESIDLEAIVHIPFHAPADR